MNPLFSSFIAGKIAVDNPITVMSYIGQGKLSDDCPRILFSTLTIFKDLNGDFDYSYTPMKSFVPTRIFNIDKGLFLENFLFFEAVTVHYLSIKTSDDLWGYIVNQQEYMKLDSSLYKRLDWVAKECDGDLSKKVNRVKDLLTLRNQIAHNLEPKYLRFKKKIYQTDDVELIADVRKIMWEGMVALCSEFKNAQSILETWLAKETLDAPRQVIVMADGSLILDGIKQK